MSDSDDDDGDLFGGGDESDDTADLIAASQSAKPAAAKKKKAAPAVKKKKPPPPAAAAAANDDDSSSDGGGGGLFDSDSSDDGGGGDKKKKAATTTTSNKKTSGRPLSKREKLEALARRKKAPGGGGGGDDDKKASGGGQPGDSGGGDGQDKGYDSGDSYDSADFERTADDDAFIDTTGEDADAVSELYAEQNFDDERPDGDDGGGGGSKKKAKGKKRRHQGEAIEDRGGLGGDAEPDNPVLAAVHRMKKKKRPKQSGEEVEEEVKLFLHQMDEAADADEQSVRDKQPALRKVQMLSAVCDTLARRDRQRLLLDFDLLSVVRRWVQPLPNGQLGNVTVRQRLLEAVAKMGGGSGGGGGVTATHLKRSGLGKTVMVLLQHPGETPAMKRQLAQLVEQWSRPIFQKSGALRDLERVGPARSRAAGSLAAVSRQQREQEEAHRQRQQERQRRDGPQDLGSLIASGARRAAAGEPSASANRVRIPFSRGFAYSVRPQGRAAGGAAAAGPDSAKRGGGGGAGDDTRGNLAKRMVEKTKAKGKNQRSANLSIEGRRTKG